METQQPLYMGIEIGGTKLQVGVGDGVSTTLYVLERRTVDKNAGAEGILRQLGELVPPLTRRFPVAGIGVGFGGPVDPTAGRVIRSHQVAGWENFAIRDWLRKRTGCPVVVGNDCDCAALAEATLGAGRGKQVVFYVTVGTGIGGGLVVGGALYGSERTARPGGPPPATCEIGHLRPGPDAESPQETVESIASGLGMETRARRLLAADAADPEQSDARFDLLSRCGTPEALSAEHLAEAALDGNELALAIIGDAVRTLGWAIAQVITLLAPDVVVVGGGVSMMPASLFWQPLRDHVATYVFPPLREHAILTRAALQEAVVVHGALALARNAASSGVTPDDGNTPYPRSTRRGGI